CVETASGVYAGFRKSLPIPPDRMGDGTQGTGSAAGSSVKMERILDDLLKKILYLSHWSVVTKKIPVRGILM
ncbi:hypothetical protein, partial [Alistipes sp.]